MATARGIEIPSQQLLDRLTRMDELLEILIKTQPGGVSVLNTPTLADQRRRAETGEWVPYAVRELSLTSARTNELLVVEGDYLVAQTDGVLDGITVRFNNLLNNAVPIRYFNPFHGFRWWRMYLTNTAQAGKTLYLMIGREASAYAESQSLTAQISYPGTPTTYNVTLTNADAEYSQALTANIRKFSIHLRDFTAFRFAYVTGKVAGPTAAYETIPAGAEKAVDGIQPAALTLYFASATAGKIAEIEEWV